MLLALGAAHGTDALVSALHRAVAFRRFRAADVRSILAAGTGTPQTRRAGDALILDLPVALTRSLDAYRIAGGRRGGDPVAKTSPPVADTEPVAPPSVPPPAADLDVGLRRLKLAAVRRSASEVLITAKTQRWTPEEVLRTLVETELAARDASNVVNRLKAAAFPVPKTLESFDLAASSIPPKTLTTCRVWNGFGHN